MRFSVYISSVSQLLLIIIIIEYLKLYLRYLELLHMSRPETAGLTLKTVKM